MNKISIYENKTLKLQNLISVKLDLLNRDPSTFDIEVQKMNTFIQTHGARQIGPLIQYSKVDLDEDGRPEVDMQFILQADNFIHGIDDSYHMESLLRAKNCLYARYIGPENKVKFAYDKLNVYAFENDIDLEGGSYTVYVNRNQEEETIMADIFMPVRE